MKCVIYSCPNPAVYGAFCAVHAQNQTRQTNESISCTWAWNYEGHSFVVDATFYRYQSGAFKLYIDNQLADESRPSQFDNTYRVVARARTRIRDEDEDVLLSIKCKPPFLFIFGRDEFFAQLVVGDTVVRA